MALCTCTRQLKAFAVLCHCNGLLCHPVLQFETALCNQQERTQTLLSAAGAARRTWQRVHELHDADPALLVRRLLTSGARRAAAQVRAARAAATRWSGSLKWRTRALSCCTCPTRTL